VRSEVLTAVRRRRRRRMFFWVVAPLHSQAENEVSENITNSIFSPDWERRADGVTARIGLFWLR
jgi:hypothetical protein